MASLAGVLPSACAPLRVLDALTPTGGYRLTLDIPYGAGERRRLDTYVPDRPQTPGRLAVFFYGGGWESGSKRDYRFVGEAMARLGVTVVIPDYRVWPEAGFPGFVADGAAAVAWARSHAGSGARVFVMGHSAGAHIAALLALDPSYLAAVGQDRRALAGLVGLAGPYDFLPLQSERLRQIFGPPELLARTQPINFADGRAPPALLLTGADDLTVRPRNSERLAARLVDAGARARAIVYPGLGHAGLVAALSTVLRGDGRVFADVAAFLNRPESVGTAA